MVVKQLDTSTCKKMNLHTDLSTFKKSSKWAIILNVKHRTIKLLEDNIVENLYGLKFGNDFFMDHQRHDP
jgi:hypothetical protein